MKKLVGFLVVVIIATVGMCMDAEANTLCMAAIPAFAVPFASLSKEELAGIVGFTQQEHEELKAKFGHRLYHITAQISDTERYDYLVVRPDKSLMLMIASFGRKEEYEKANDAMIKNCVKAGDREALEDFAVYQTVLESIQQISKGQAAFIRKA